jgi:hypothetical protein
VRALIRWPGRGARWAALANAALALGCGATPRSTPAPPSPSGGAAVCSQMHRAVSRWQGADIEDSECGPDVTGLLELTPIGNHELLVRRRFSSYYDVWQVDAACTTSGGPIQVSASPAWMQAGFTLMPASTPQVLIYDPRLSTLSIDATELSPKQGGVPFASERTGSWPATGGFPLGLPLPGGHQFVGLENGFLFDRDLGDGRTAIWRIVVSELWRTAWLISGGPISCSTSTRTTGPTPAS